MDKNNLLEIRQVIDELKDKVAESGEVTFKNILQHKFFNNPKNDFTDELNENIEKNSVFKFDDNISENQIEEKIIVD